MPLSFHFEVRSSYSSQLLFAIIYGYSSQALFSLVSNFQAIKNHWIHFKNPLRVMIKHCNTFASTEYSYHTSAEFSQVTPFFSSIFTHSFPWDYACIWEWSTIHKAQCLHFEAFHWMFYSINESVARRSQGKVSGHLLQNNLGYLLKVLSPKSRLIEPFLSVRCIIWILKRLPVTFIIKCSIKPQLRKAEGGGLCLVLKIQVLMRQQSWYRSSLGHCISPPESLNLTPSLALSPGLKSLDCSL